MSDQGLRFVKMSGAGNDFLVLGPDSIGRLPERIEPWAQRVCRRGLSVGADGVLLVEPAIGAERIRVRFFNPDGSTAFCGNGSRCAARFAQLEGLAGESMVLDTCAGQVPADVDGERVRLRLSPPTDHGTLQLEIGDETVHGRHVEAGTAHFVCWVDDPARSPLERWGPAIRRHPHFAPAGTNFNLADRDGDRVRLRTWEKGVERETLACGSGAVATAAAARAEGAGERVQILPASGIPLEVRFEAGASWLIGDARVVFEGRLAAEAILGFPS